MLASQIFIIISMKLVIALICLCVTQVSCIKFIIHVSRADGPKCFYQFLNAGQKYSLTAKSMNANKFRMDVYRQEGHKWEEVYKKQVSNSFESISKMASSRATHMFCLSHLEDGVLRIGVTFMSGLELGELKTLPTKDDHQLLNQNINWMEDQKSNLIKILQRIEGSEASQNLKNSSGGMLLWLAVFGLIGIIGINYVFFRYAKKTLRDRKLI